jgi:hypothetical protein
VVADEEDGGRTSTTENDDAWRVDARRYRTLETTERPIMKTSANDNNAVRLSNSAVTWHGAAVRWAEFQALAAHEGSIEDICGQGRIAVVVLDASQEVGGLLEYIFGERSLSSRVFAMNPRYVRKAARDARARRDEVKERWFGRQDAPGAGRVVLVVGDAIRLLDITPSAVRSAATTQVHGPHSA